MSKIKKEKTKTKELSNVKSFFMPSIIKIVLTVVIGIVSYKLSYTKYDYGNMRCVDCLISESGFPLAFYVEGGLYRMQVSKLFLTLDIICWYIVSCLIVYLFKNIYKSFKK